MQMHTFITPSKASSFLMSRPLLTELPSNPCEHNAPTSEPNKVAIDFPPFQEMPLPLSAFCSGPPPKIHLQGPFQAMPLPLASFYSGLSIASQNPPPVADPGRIDIDIPPSPNCHLVHTAQKCSKNSGSAATETVISGFSGDFCPLCPQTLLTHFVRRKNFA